MSVLSSENIFLPLLVNYKTTYCECDAKDHRNSYSSLPTCTHSAGRFGVFKFLFVGRITGVRGLARCRNWGRRSRAPKWRIWAWSWSWSRTRIRTPMLTETRTKTRTRTPMWTGARCWIRWRHRCRWRRWGFTRRWGFFRRKWRRLSQAQMRNERYDHQICKNSLHLLNLSN